MEKETGFRFRVISGDEEARLTFQGALLPDLKPEASAVIDIGGGSTELIAAKRELGIVYPSVRHHGGTCLAAFHPYVVQNLRQGGLWRLTWVGDPEPAVKRVA